MRYEFFALIPAILFLFIVIYFAIIYKYTKMLVKPPKRSVETLIEYEVAEKKFNRDWLEIPFEKMEMKSDYGYNLVAKYFENQVKSKKIMISLHGHGSSTVSQMKYLNMFFEEGFNVFMPNHRYSGESEGNSISLAVYEHEDVIKWIKILKEKFPGYELHIFGESMGAATAIMVTAKEKDIKSLIEYCGFYDIPTLVKHYVKKESVAKIVYPSIRFLTRLLYKIDLAKSKAGECMKTIDCPVLMIHSRADKVVSYENAQKFKSDRPDINLITFEDSAHARTMVKYPDEFKAAVHQFFIENNIVSD